MEFLNFIKDIISELNINGIDAIYLALISLITVLLFKHFYSNINSYKKKESEEINKSLESFQNVLISIKKHELNTISTEDLYYEIMSLLSICSVKLKNEIMNTDTNNNESLEELKENIVVEFNALKFDQNTICKKYTESVIYTYSYMFKNNGFFNIFIAMSYTVITFVTLFTCMFLLVKLDNSNILDQVILLGLLGSFSFYVFLLISIIESFTTRRFNGKIINIIALIIFIISPTILMLVKNIYTVFVFCGITILYLIIIFPKSIRKIR
ncbi:MAG: hypothetical protein K0S41_1412 [Anaerocolumna sp.]|jgi:hypothetical protein|nr:hypothetical protein [Anaerocolumna sp.]